MELKSFKTYLSEQEDLNEFIGPLVGLAARVPSMLGAARTALGARAAAGAARVRQIASSRGAMNATNAAMLMRGAGAGSEAQETTPYIDNTTPQTTTRSNTNQAAMTSRASIQGTNVPGFASSTTPVALQTLYGMGGIGLLRNRGVR